MHCSITTKIGQATALLTFIFTTQFLLKYGLNANQVLPGYFLRVSSFLWIFSGAVFYFWTILLIRNQKIKMGNAAVFFGGFIYIFVVGLAAFFFNEYVSLSQWVGVGLISVGVILVSGDY